MEITRQFKDKMILINIFKNTKTRLHNKNYVNTIKCKQKVKKYTLKKHANI